MADRAGTSKPKRIRKPKKRDPAKKTLPCPECGRKFYFNCQLKEHMYIHTGEKPYKCDVCDKAFNTTYSLRTHKFIHTDEKPFKCSFCDYACRDSSTLRKHQAKHGGKQTFYQCKTCDKTYLDKWRLKNHVAETHLNMDIRTIPCQICKKLFKSNSQLNFHVKSIHERANAGHCPVCKVYLSNMNNLGAHLTTHVDARPYVCNVPGCDKAYKDKSSLTKHVVKHYPGKQYECEICQRVFLSKSRVKYHILTVHGKRKRVECDYCGVKFFSKAYLINHITKKHTNRRKYKYICDICGMKTYNKPSIVMHLKYGHGNENDRECTICKTIYKKYIYLKHHYKYVHNIAYKTRTRQTNQLIIKEEPPDDDNISIASIDLFEIEKTEPDVPDSMAEETGNPAGLPQLQTIIECERLVDIPQDVFDQFYVETYQKNTLEDNEPKESKTNSNYTVNEEALEQQKNAKIQILEEAKKRNAIEAIEQAKIQAELRKRESVKALERVRLMYNERMRNFVDKLTNEEDKKPIKVKMFQAKRTKVPKNDIEHTKTSIVNNNTSDVTNTDEENDLENNTTEFTNPKNGGNIANEENCDLVNGLTDKAEVDDDDKDTKQSCNNEKSKINHNKIDNKIEKISNKDLELENENDEINGDNDGIEENDDAKQSERDDKESAAGDTSEDDDDEWISKSKEKKKINKMNFNSHQCYICFKLYETKEKLLDHCKNHFDVCNETRLKKCPLCPYVSNKNLTRHMKLVHKIKLKIPYMKIQDKKDNSDGCRYYFEINDPKIRKIEVIPSVKNLNKLASMKIDKKNREDKCKALAKTKLVRKGKEWIVETEKITIDKGVIMPKFDSDAIKNLDGKIGDSDAYFDSLKKMYHLAKKSGKTMLFPCQSCDKVCRNFAALKLHNRKHETNPKPFRKKVWKHKLKDGAAYKKVETRKLDSTNRTAKPKPIRNKHKCDPELKDFYKNNITGGDIEFWQFLKIFNKMSRDNIEDFKDLEGRHEYGINLGYIPETDEQDKIKNDKETPTNSKSHGNNNKDDHSLATDKIRKDIVSSTKQTKVNKYPNKKIGKDDKYKRVIRIRKKEYEKRNAMKQKLRERIAQNSVEEICKKEYEKRNAIKHKLREKIAQNSVEENT